MKLSKALEGSRRRVSRVPSDDILRIVRMYLAGRTFREIAEVTGFTHSKVSMVVTRARRGNYDNAVGDVGGKLK